ncbi:MAG TPA: GH116 family glycosyl-hydrolase [Patescibacteria group bacterium]|nr:GH116 family glycosyl-hydrolase [Patescibacteria group bacterium]
MSNSGSRPVRKCSCSGVCGTPGVSVSRREFLQLVGVGSTALLASPALAAFDLPPEQMEHWQRTVVAEASVLRYLSDKHSDARMHLGGIGTGNFEIGADGQFTTWQLFNTLRDGHVPFHLVARVNGVSRLLQTTGGPDWPKIKQIEMTGEYPFARLRFIDEQLPVNLELSAFSPFAPLDTAVSSIPVATLVFKINNPNREPCDVSIGALMQNPVGYEAQGENLSLTNACFGGNVNEVLHEGKLCGLVLQATPAADATLDRPVAIYTLANLEKVLLPPADRPANLQVHIIPGEPLAFEQLSERSKVVLWIEEATATIQPSFLDSLHKLVTAGASLVFAGRAQPLLETYASWTGGKPINEVDARPDIVFEDFENGYGNWQVEGQAFGARPAEGTLPNQQKVSGFLGHGLVNTYLGGDDTTGRLTSNPFRIERRFIRFLIGGGRHKNTQIRLVIDQEAVRATAGKDNERLEPAVWDVSAMEGKTAHIEIVDAQTGGWGHINVDQIEFSDLPGSRELMVLLEALLPLRFSAVRQLKEVSNSAKVEFENPTLQPGAAQRVTGNGVSFWSRPVGKGQVMLMTGPVLDPANAGISQARQQAYALLCGFVGAKYSASPGVHQKAPGFGTLALMTLGPRPTVLRDGTNWTEAWNQFSAEGGFHPPAAGSSSPTAPGMTIFGGVASTVTVPAHASLEVPFLLAWHYPNKYNSRHEWIGCHYANQWPSAKAVAVAAAQHLQLWRQKTERFHQVLYDSSLPYWLLDCLTANAAILRHIGVVFRIANADVYGWEGSNGCCDPTCTHVWGYEQSFARLFPELEKDMRRIDFKHQQRSDGGINNRTEVPSPPHPSGEQPFADGHASCILKAYREALNHPNEGFFQEYWPRVKRAVEYLVTRDANSNAGQPAGVLRDDQWNTYDEALHGVTTFISGYYLAALRAGAEWARRVGDSASANHFQEIFHRGQNRLVELCWNGAYFQQHLPDYDQRQGEVGPGCMSDQLIGQWWAHQLGLGYILPREKVVSSLEAVFRYNFKSDLTNWKHSPRAFAGARDKGLIICTWPKGGRPPGVMLYSDEVWTGIEYQVASHLIYEGLIEQGLSIVKAARERYDGIPRPPIARNPWNEIECGGHYARAMSSWSLLLALSGWLYDGPRADLLFSPRHQVDNFKSFFTGPEGWGSVRQLRKQLSQTNEISVAEGQLQLARLSLQLSRAPAKVRVEIAGHPLKPAFVFDGSILRLTLNKPINIKAGQTLRADVSLRQV